MLRLWILPVLGLIATLGIACGDEGEDSQTNLPGTATETASPSVSQLPTTKPTAAPDSVLWRWLNVTLRVSPASGIRVIRGPAPAPLFPPNGGQVLELDIWASDTGSSTLIDATNGQLIFENVRPQDRAAFDEVLASLEVGPPMQGDARPWPYDSAEPQRAKVNDGNTSIRYWEPDPAAGINVSYGCGIGPVQSGTSHPGSGCFLRSDNGRSRRSIDASSGGVIALDDKVLPEDVDAFDRFTESVELVQS
jgi:hypothetical protein